VPVTAVLGPVVSFNIFTLCNFTLAGFCTYLLVRELTGSRLAAVFSGIFFAFCPFMYAHSIVHMDVGATWPLPLTFYALLRLDRQRTWENGLFLLLALMLFHCYCSIYYYLFFPLAALVYLLVRFFNGFFYEFETGRGRLGRFSRVTAFQWTLVAGGALVLIAAGIAVYKYYLGAMASELVRPLHWQERFKLSWANYLLPGVDHPLFGKTTSSMVPIRRNVTESTAFVGWIPLVLSVWGFWSARGNWRAWMFLVFGLVSLSFTLGPYLSLGYLKLPMPSVLLHKIAPFIRVISRYSIFVQLAVAVLAGFGMLRLIDLLQRKNIVLPVLAAMIVALCLGLMPPRGTTTVAASADKAPPVYRFLAGLEDDACVFEYPPCARTGNALGDYLYWQTVHGKRLFNRHFETTTIPEKYLPFWQDLDYPGALSDPNNVRLLKRFGVDYLAFHDRRGTHTAALPAVDLGKIEGLDLVEDFGKSAVYRVTAEPATVLVAFDTRPLYNYLEVRRKFSALAFEAPMVYDAWGESRGWRVMHERGRLILRNLLDKPQTVELEALAVSVGKPRRVEVRIGGGQAIVATVGTEPSPLRVPGIRLEPGGEVELILASLDGVAEEPKARGGKLGASIALASVSVLSRSVAE
ncbi:MAG: hypothetical protein U9P14_06925, partial [Gemmatimonadota bacterium]|nr:hypothetical protein [Gemmatimonadota bacterium]